MDERQLAKDFIRLQAQGERFVAMGLVTEMIARWGIKLDWHEFAYALDELERTDEVARVRNPQRIYTEYERI